MRSQADIIDEIIYGGTMVEPVYYANKCVCGHVLGDHADELACTIAGCSCIHFEGADTMAEHPESESLKATEERSARGAKGKRVTLGMIQDNIEAIWYTTGDRCIPERMQLAAVEKLKIMTLCFAVTRSGFIVVGKSAPMDATNFDPVKGRTFAYEDAIRQLWPLMAFAQLERDHYG